MDKVKKEIESFSDEILEVKTEIQEVKRELKKVHWTFLLLPFFQGFFGAYNTLGITSIINSDSYLHQLVLKYVQNQFLQWLICVALIINMILFELKQVNFWIISLKLIGASLTTITIYISNFGFTTLFSILTQNHHPNIYQWIGSSFMIFGVMVISCSMNRQFKKTQRKKSSEKKVQTAQDFDMPKYDLENENSMTDQVNNQMAIMSPDEGSTMKN